MWSIAASLHMLLAFMNEFRKKSNHRFLFEPNKHMVCLEIFLAKSRGFCGGVARAIKMVENALDKFGAPVYVLHEIVHNTRVLSDLKKKGVIFVEKLDQIPDKSIVILSAHGVSPAIEDYAKSKQLQVIDATCSLVKRVHSKAHKYESEGRQVIIIGNKNHPEVVGTAGRLKRPIIISSNEEAESVTVPDPSNVAVVTQTTLNSDDTAQIITVLKRKFPKIAGTDENGDICNATKARQEAVKELVKSVDALFVVGSKNSSNSNKLKGIGTDASIPSYLIDGPEDINLDWLQRLNRIGITTGASAPEHVVQEVIDFLSTHRKIRVVSH